MNQLTRKQFLKSSLALGGTALLGHSRLGAAVAAPGSPNGDIRVAVVGLNKQGAGHMRTYFNLPGAKLAALCDVDAQVLGRRIEDCEKQGLKVASVHDYRELLERKDVDAVVLATPNHQHSIQTIWALQAGKDVYVEKPLSHNIWEGRQAVAAAEKYTKNIAYAGTQNRSSLDLQNALGQVRAGKFGKILWARGLCYKRRDSIGQTTGAQPVPPSLDYDLWCGPAPLELPHRNSKENGTVHYDWHWFWQAGGGDITNQGIHQMDVARWLLGESGLPTKVQSFGGRFGYDDDAETPNTLVSVFHYEKAPLIFEVRGLPMKPGMRAMDRYRAAQIGVILQCEHGYVHAAENGTVTIYDNNHKVLQNLAEGGNGQHRANFIKAVQSREVVNAPVLEAHYSSALCHLGNLSYLAGREQPVSAVGDALKSHELAKEAFDRTAEHLKANGVGLDSAKMVLGPVLTVDRATETVTADDRAAADAANGSPLRKRSGRAGFEIPQLA
ncbi:MAG TPA: Gfo/Idh/MocA family oxidoreductase [Opitutaceae bacterium]|nr:Gfo/Idh/MocA family oxidoreductase [Opitutaceae bacterium]